MKISVGLVGIMSADGCDGWNNSRTSKFDLVFEDMSRPGTVQVPILLEKLSRIQEALYATGAYLMKESPKETGRYSDPIHDHFTITLTGLKKGSTEVCLQITDPFGGLHADDQPIGGKAIDTIEQAVEIIEEEEEPFERMAELIKDDIYRRRISRALYNIYPNETQGGMSLRFSSQRKKILNPDHRGRFEDLMKAPEAGEAATISGPVVKWDLMKNNIQVWTERGKIKCGFAPELGPEVIRYAGQIVEISGAGPFNKDGMPKELVDISNIAPKSEMILEKITSGNIEYELTRSIRVKIDFNMVDKTWTIKNDELDIVAVGKDWDKALAEFQDEFIYLVEHYRSAKDKELSEGSIKLKKYILELVG